MRDVYFKQCKLFSYETLDISEDLIKNVEMEFVIVWNDNCWKMFKLSLFLDNKSLVEILAILL
mgnify:CR=1 FL=1